jgi:anaerobic magnesium-protoporphyrin IX monomethyl ester cyclase
MKIRNVTLLRCEPESSNVYSSFSHPGLALPIIGTVLRHTGRNVRVFVDSIQPASPEDVAWGQLVGFSVNSASVRETYRRAARVRAECTRPIVFGGPHVTFRADEALDHGDFVVRGEGERTIVDLVDAIESGATDFSNIAGLSWRDAGGVVRHNADRPPLEDFNLVPDQSLIAGYRELNRRWTQSFFPTGMLVSTSRGCPFTCTFCTIHKVYGRGMRFRDHDAVLADIRQQSALAGHRYIYFADDNFTGHRGRVKELLRRIIGERLNLRFSAQVRADTTRDPELMQLLAHAGCYLAFVGFESINDATLRAFRKGNQTRASCEEAVRSFHRHGIMVHGMFIAGGDDDPPGTALATAKWAIEQRLESIQILPLCPLPGTDTLQQLETDGRLYRSWDPVIGRSIVNYGAGNFVLHEPKLLPAVQLQHEILMAHRLFYSRANVWRSALRGLNPFLFRLLGRAILKRAATELEGHAAWLASAVPSGRAVAEVA